MPYFNDTSSESTFSPGVAPTTMAGQAGAAQFSMPSDSGTPFGNALGMMGLAPLDLLDSIASNKYVSNVTGLNRGDVSQAALNAVGMPGAAQFYLQHKEGVETLSGIGGVVAASLLAEKVMAPASAVMGVMREIPYVKRIAQLDQEYTNALGVVKSGDMALASRGAAGLEQYTGAFTVDGLKFDAKAGAYVNSEINTTRSASVFKAKALGFAKGARNAAVTEGIAYSALNANGFLYSDDAGSNLMWQTLGIAGGGLGEFLHGAYQIRKFANSDGVKRAFANALDPDGIETGRLMWRGKAVDPAPAESMALGGTWTDQITSELSSVASLKNTPVEGPDAGSLLANRSRLAIQHEKLAVETAQKVTTKGVSGFNQTRFNMNTPEYGNHLAMALHDDPTLLYGAEMVGAIPEAESAIGVHANFMNSLEERINRVEEIIADPQGLTDAESAKLQATRRRLDYMQKLTPSSLVDGELMPLSEASVFDEWKEPAKIQFTNNAAFGDKDAGGIFHVLEEDGRVGASLDTDFTIHLPNNKDLGKADLFDVMKLYRAGGKLLNHMRNWTAPIMIPANPNWFHLDMAEQLLRSTEGKANIIWPKGMTRDSAMVESLAQKAEYLKTQESKIAKAEDPEAMMSQMRLRLNLPKLNSYERGLLGVNEGPVDRLLRGASELGVDKLREMPLQDVKQTMVEFKRLGDMTSASAKDADTLGKSFNFMMDNQGRPVKPLLIYKRPMKTIDWTQHSLEESLAARQMHTVGVMAGPDAAPMTQTMTGTLMADPDVKQAMSTHELMDSQIQGSMVGAAPQTFLGSLGNSVRTDDFLARDTPTLLAASRVQDKTQRLARDFMQRIVDGAFGGSQNLLSNPRNAASKLLLDQFHSFRSGWDLEAKVASSGDGFHRFTLGDTEANRTRWRKQYGSDMPKGQTLLAPTGKEVVLDDMGLDLQQRFNSVTQQLMAEKNTLLRARGLPEINAQNWYVPPPNTNGKYIGFVMGPDNKPVPGLSVVAGTPGEFEASKTQVLEHLKSEGKGLGYTFRTQQEIHDFANIWDQVQMDMANPGITALQPGKQAKGLLTGRDLLPSAFDESMKYLRDGFLNHSNDILDTLFKNQINANKARSAMAAPIKANNAKFGDIKYKSVYDIYNENLLGRSKLSSTGSVIGKVWNTAEGLIDEALGSAAPTAAKAAARVTDTWDATNAWINRHTPWSSTDKAKRDFDSLVGALGEHMPYASAAEMIEKQGLGVRPWTAKGMGSELNKWAAAGFLRMMEVAHPIMNMAGIVNAMPAVIRSFAQRQGETVEDFAARVGHSSMIFNLKDGTNLAIPDMAKIGGRAFKRAWQETSHADYDYMVRRGYLSQEVAEFHRQFGSIDSKGSWSKFFEGDTSITNPSTVADRLKQKGLVGWMSVLSDKSEDFSRSWAHMVGLELSDHLGIAGVENRNAFAHDVANKMIANYTPHNRPEIFQGAVGSTIGLFQSFIQEYYQRMFRYVETKDYAALIHQYVAQSALFGINSIPGFAEYNHAQQFLSKRGDDADSGIRHRLGQNAADFFQHGVISNIPTLFGGQGVDLYSRGDTQIRLPGGSMPPALAFTGKIAQGFMDAIQAFKDEQGITSPQQLAEIVANAMPNRPIAGLIQQMSGGDQVDRAGQLISDTKSNLEMTYRILGLRSERQSNDVSSYYANKVAMTHKASADSMLRLATRAAIRGGNTEAVPAIYQKYLDNGGDPRQFSKWIKSNYEAATQTRSSRQLDKDLKAVYKDPYKMGQITRMLDAGVTTSQNESGPDVSAFSKTPSPQMNQPSGYLGAYDSQMTAIPPN